MTQPPDWEQARCKVLAIPSEVFFFEDWCVPKTPEYSKARKAALAVCRACPIMDECAAWAIEENMEGGLWGGLTSSRRRRIRRRLYQEAVAELQVPPSQVQPPRGER